MPAPKNDTKTGERNHGAFGSEPPAEKDALTRYKDKDQLQPQGYPADKKPAAPDAAGRSDQAGKKKQLGE